MQLVPITAEDQELTIRLECDPEMMRHIGGPRWEGEVRAAHQRRLALMEKGEADIYKIVAEDADEVLGTIGIWPIDWQSPQSYEVCDSPQKREKFVPNWRIALIETFGARSNPLREIFPAAM